MNSGLKHLFVVVDASMKYK